MDYITLLRNAYRIDFLKELLQSSLDGRTSIRFRDTEGNKMMNILLCKNDVERTPENALKLARIYRELGINAAFYFHTRKNVYNIGVMSAIQDLNHEVGYHYECLDRCRGDFRSARELFKREVEMFRKDGFDLHTVAYHDENLIKKIGYKTNYELIMKYPELLNECGLDFEASFILKTNKFVIINDRYSKINLMVEALYNPEHLKKNSNIYVLIHPDRWRNNLLGVLRYNSLNMKQYLSNFTYGHRKYSVEDH